jgi:hypothetical protein
MENAREQKVIGLMRRLRAEGLSYPALLPAWTARAAIWTETLMVSSIWSEGDGSDSPLPAPNVVVAWSGTTLDELSPQAIKGILVNPMYTGVGPFPRLVQDDAWVRACAKLIKEEGSEQFLVNLLHVLRKCFGDGSVEE